jgi:hypothetical protein
MSGVGKGIEVVVVIHDLGSRFEKYIYEISMDGCN